MPAFPEFLIHPYKLPSYSSPWDSGAISTPQEETEALRREWLDTCPQLASGRMGGRRRAVSLQTQALSFMLYCPERDLEVQVGVIKASSLVDPDHVRSPASKWHELAASLERVSSVWLPSSGM